MPGFVTHAETRRSPRETFDSIIDLATWPTFRGWGPLPGIVSATVVSGGTDGRLAPGARVRVTNTDGSVHHEIVEELVAGRRYRVRMELGPPARHVLARIDEVVDLEPAPGGGTRLTRRFDVTPRSPLAWPIAWLVARVFLRRAVLAHNATVTRALDAVRSRSDRQASRSDATDAPSADAG